MSSIDVIILVQNIGSGAFYETKTWLQSHILIINELTTEILT